MNEFLILYTLLKNNANIYEIKKFINTYFAPFAELSTGAIIPALKRLEQANCVTTEKSVSDGGLRRSVYTISDTGINKINEYIAEEIEGAPQLVRREIEILMLVIDDEIFTDEQRKSLKNKIKFALEKQTTILKNAINIGKMNLEFLNTELIYTESKIRMLIEK